MKEEGGAEDVRHVVARRHRVLLERLLPRERAQGCCELPPGTFYDPNEWDRLCLGEVCRSNTVFLKVGLTLQVVGPSEPQELD